MSGRIFSILHLRTVEDAFPYDLFGYAALCCDIRAVKENDLTPRVMN